jgi:hypothetical protein
MGTQAGVQAIQQINGHIEELQRAYNREIDLGLLYVPYTSTDNF